MTKWIRNDNALAALKEVERHARRDLSIALRHLAKKVMYEIKRDIEHWYKTYQPVEYNRTMSYINALVVGNVIMTGRDISVEIYFDPAKLELHHSDFPGLPFVVDKGWTMPWVPGWSREGSHAISGKVQELQSGGILGTFNRRFANELKARGYNVSVQSSILDM